MLSKIARFFSEKITAAPELQVADHKNHQLMIATAALFLEVASADFEISAEEKNHIKVTLKQFFDIRPDEVDDLLESAQHARETRNDIWLFTNLIKESFDRGQRLGILENLWTIILADDSVDKYEDSVIRKINNLLGLEHGDMISAKIKAQKQSAMAVH